MQNKYKRITQNNIMPAHKYSSSQKSILNNEDL